MAPHRVYEQCIQNAKLAVMTVVLTLRSKIASYIREVKQNERKWIGHCKLYTG